MPGPDRATTARTAGLEPPPLRRRPPGVRRNFTVTYLLGELRRRSRQVAVIAAGLGVGVGLVMTVAAASAAVAEAQTEALHSLYGIGTDLTIIKPTPAGEGSSAGGSSQAGTLTVGNLGLLPSESVRDVAKRHGVDAAAGGLLLSELTQTGANFPTTVTVDGIDLAHLGLGPIASGTITSGRGFAARDGNSDVAVVGAAYAAANGLHVGSTTLAGNHPFLVIGIINQARVGNSADVYIPLARAQAITRYGGRSNLRGEINVIYVAAASASDVGHVQAQMSRLFPKATIVSSASLAGAVSGSLGVAARLAGDLGQWVAASALGAACAISSLLNLASIQRRLRELGTLEALGWRTTRIVGQILAEALTIGIAGVLSGVAAGLGGIAALNVLAPKLTVPIPEADGTGNPSTVVLRLDAHADLRTILAAAGLALAAALIAGCLGAWRAARLQPADAFSQLP